MESTIPKSMAVQKLLTSNPLITLALSMINKALITNVNRPKVRMLIGSVRRIKIGFKIALAKPIKRASHKAVQKPATDAPVIK